MFSRLSLGIGNLPSSVTIIPAARLFGFTWQLSLQDEKFLIESSRVAIAPSATWLIASRSNLWKGRAQRRSWIGSAASPDWRRSTRVAILERKLITLALGGSFISMATKHFPCLGHLWHSDERDVSIRRAVRDSERRTYFGIVSQEGAQNSSRGAIGKSRRVSKPNSAHRANPLW